MNKNSKMAFIAMLSAVAVVILYVGSAFGKVDIAVSVIASLCVSFALFKLGYIPALAVYGVASALGLLLCPAKTAALLFFAFFGYYPVLKMYAESRFSKVTAYIAKYLFMNGSLVLLVALALSLVKIYFVVILAIFAVANVVLWLYDVVYGKVSVMCYDRVLRKRK